MMVRSEMTNIAARLALGFAALIEQDIDTAKCSFAFASWLAGSKDLAQSGEPKADSSLKQQLNFARAFVLGVARHPSHLDDAPSIRIEDLALPQAYWLRANGNIAAALAEYDRWMKNGLLKHVRDVHRAYRIIRQNGIYYAVPVAIPLFIVLVGVVYRVPYRVIRVLRKAPLRLRLTLRSIQARFSGDSTAGAGGRGEFKPAVKGFLGESGLRRFLRFCLGSSLRLVLFPLIVSNSFSAEDRWTLIAKIDAQAKAA